MRRHNEARHLRAGDVLAETGDRIVEVDLSELFTKGVVHLLFAAPPGQRKALRILARERVWVDI